MLFEYKKNNLLKVVIPYAVFGSLYIILSDIAAKLWAPDADQLFTVSILKGLAYILVTSILVYFLVRNYTQKMLRVNDQYLNVFRSMPEPVLIIDSRTNKVLDENESAREFFGFSYEEFRSLTPNSLFNPNSSDTDIREFLKHPKKKTESEFIAITKDFSEIPVYLSAAPVISADNQHYKVLIARDLSEIKSQQELSKENEEKLNAVLDGVKAVIWWDTFKPHGFFYINREVEHLFEVSREKIGEDRMFWMNRAADEDRVKLEQAVERLKSGKTKKAQVEYRIETPKGKIKWVRIRVWVNFEKRKTNFRGIIIDITPEKEYQKQQELYLKKVENFAFSIAHEVRRPLSNMLGLISLYKESTPAEQADIFRVLEQSAGELDQEVRSITKDMEKSKYNRD